MIADLVTAFRFLTVLPFGNRSHSMERLAPATRFFPLVGAFIAAVALLGYYGAEILFSHRVAALFLLILPVLLTGGLHLDGWGDFCDGFFGGHDRASVLRIMKDTHTGVFGITGIVLVLLTKYVLLSEMAELVPWGFLLALAGSRWVQVVLGFSLPYAGEGGGLGEKVAKKVRGSDLMIATLFFLIPVAFCLAKGVWVFLGLLIFLVAFGSYARSRIGGITGDVIGAASELSEIVILFIYAAFS
jgi:adenosylcobinamide-GDP ribazoletransferase